MAESSKIAWTHATFNGWRGCEHATLPDGTAHPGCFNCYAEAMAKRNHKLLGTWGGDGIGKRIRGTDDYWGDPLKWDRKARDSGERKRVFCESMSDVFEDWPGPILDVDERRLWWNDQRIRFSMPIDFTPAFSIPVTIGDLRAELFRLIDETLWLDWLVLTKRPWNIVPMTPIEPTGKSEPIFPGMPGPLGRPLPTYSRKRRNNLWLGSSISNQPTADAIVPALLQARALSPVLFLSIEPFLAPVNLRTGTYLRVEHGGEARGTTIEGIDWVIVGVESRGSRVGSLGEFASEAEWIRGAVWVVEQCHAAGVPVFVKQIPIRGFVAHDVSRFPPELQFQEFPKVQHA